MRKKFILLLKITFSLLIIFYLVTRISLQQVFHSWQLLSLGTSFVLILLLLVNLVFQLLRWKIMVLNHIPHAKFYHIVKSFFAGFALRLSVPGGHAEIGKIFMVKGTRKEALLAFGTEKYIITSTQFLLLGLAGWHVLPQFKGGFIAIVAAALVLFAAYPFFPKFPFLKRYMNPELSYSASMIMVAALTIIVYALVTTQYYIMIFPENILSWFETASIVMLLIGSAMIPISYSGLGIREGVGIFLFGPFGLTDEKIVSMTLFIFFMNTVIPALIGVIFLLKHRK